MRTMRADSLRNEADYLPRSIDDLAELRRRIIEAGHAPNVANGLVGWLVSKAAGERDVTGPDTRSKYRKILAELDETTPGPGRGRRGELTVVGGRPADVDAGAQNPRFRRYVKLAAAA